MDTSVRKSLISNYRKNRSIDEYRLLEKIMGSYKKCRICNDSIFYKNSLIRMSKDGSLYYDKNYPSCESTKVVFDSIFYLTACQSCVSKEFPEYSENNKTKVYNTLNKITCFAFNIDPHIMKKYNKSKSVTLQNMIRKYGEAEGNIRWKKYVKFQSDKNKFSYKNEKYGWSREEFDIFNRSRAVTIENLIRRHGEEGGRDIYEEYVKKQRINGKTIEWFIEKNGEEKGRMIFNSMMYKKMIGSKNANSGSAFTSKVSSEFFNRLDAYFHGFNTQYYDKNGEYSVFVENNRFFHLDYYIHDIMVCVEFFGDFFHANPMIYKDSEKIINIYGKALSVGEIWDKDRKRIKEIKEKCGIETVIVWEKDYYNNKKNQSFYKKILKECLKKSNITL